MRRRGLAALGAAGAALVVAVALASAPGSAARPVENGWRALAADAGAEPAGQAARRRCRPARRERATGGRARVRRVARHRRKKARPRRSRCTRVKRLTAAPPSRERLTPVELAPRSPDGGGGAPAPSTPGPGDWGGGSPPPLLRFVSVAAREWSLTLSRPLVGAGSVTIELQNDGEDPHNLIVSPDDDSHTPLAAWAELLPGEYQRGPVTLSAGRYLLWCSLEGHEAAGMSVRLRVE